MFSTVGATAATISVGRGTGNPGISVNESSGTALSTGGFYFAVGTFSSGGLNVAPPVITDYASLVAATSTFQIWKETTTSTVSPTFGLLNGSFATTTATEGTNADYQTLEMYFLVGNKASYALSTEWAIFKLTAGTPDFIANLGSATTTAVTLSTGATITTLGNAGSVSGNVLTLVGAPVPEPSAALLGMLGALGLLRRRR